MPGTRNDDDVGEGGLIGNWDQIKEAEAAKQNGKPATAKNTRQQKLTEHTLTSWPGSPGAEGLAVPNRPWSGERLLWGLTFCLLLGCSISANARRGKGLVRLMSRSRADGWNLELSSPSSRNRVGSGRRRSVQVDRYLCRVFRTSVSGGRCRSQECRAVDGRRGGGRGRWSFSAARLVRV